MNRRVPVRATGKLLGRVVEHTDQQRAPTVQGDFIESDVSAQASRAGEHWAILLSGPNASLKNVSLLAQGKPNRAGADSTRLRSRMGTDLRQVVAPVRVLSRIGVEVTRGARVDDRHRDDLRRVFLERPAPVVAFSGGIDHGWRARNDEDVPGVAWFGAAVVGRLS